METFDDVKNLNEDEFGEKGVPFVIRYTTNEMLGDYSSNLMEYIDKNFVWVYRQISEKDRRKLPKLDNYNDVSANLKYIISLVKQLNGLKKGGAVVTYATRKQGNDEKLSDENIVNFDYLIKFINDLVEIHKQIIKLQKIVGKTKSFEDLDLLNTLVKEYAEIIKIYNNSIENYNSAFDPSTLTGENGYSQSGSAMMDIINSAIKIIQTYGFYVKEMSSNDACEEMEENFDARVKPTISKEEQEKQKIIDELNNEYIDVKDIIRDLQSEQNYVTKDLRNKAVAKFENLSKEHPYPYDTNIKVKTLSYVENELNAIRQIIEEIQSVPTTYVNPADFNNYVEGVRTLY